MRFNRKIMNKQTPVVFDKNTVEFVTVAAECCGFLERTPEMEHDAFIVKALKLLPLLYLKASLLPKAVRMDDAPLEAFVSEGDYERVRASIATLMGSDDDYLDVFLEDMAFCDTPIKQEISETLADIYQPLKDFVCVYRLGLERTMNDAVAECRRRFAEFWGQRLLNAMRALHDVKYRQADADEYDDGSYGDADYYNNPDMADEDIYDDLPE